MLFTIYLHEFMAVVGLLVSVLCQTTASSITLHNPSNKGVSRNDRLHCARPQPMGTKKRRAADAWMEYKNERNHWERIYINPVWPWGANCGTFVFVFTMFPSLALLASQRAMTCTTDGLTAHILPGLFADLLILLVYSFLCSLHELSLSQLAKRCQSFMAETLKLSLETATQVVTSKGFLAVCPSTNRSTSWKRTIAALFFWPPPPVPRGTQ